MRTAQATKELASRGVARIFPEDRFQELIRAKRPLRVKFGIDPTGPLLHIGRAVPLWKLREFQDLGHQIVLIVGDFTALIGDPSDKLKRRPVLTPVQIAQNLKKYKEQLGIILDLKKVEFRYNSEWLTKLTPDELVRLARQVTVNQMLARHNFKERFERGAEIGLDEFLYPLFQGFDSVAVKADMELGGTDQLFNLQVGRVMQEAYGQPPQVVFITDMLLGTDGRKMSTSWGNVVNILDPPNEQFAKLMAMADGEIVNYAKLAALLPEPAVKKLARLHPRLAKAQVAEAIVALYHGAKPAKLARTEFDRVFQKKEKPKDVPTIALPAGTYHALALFEKTKLIASRSEAKRLLAEGAIKINDVIVRETDESVTLAKGETLLIQRGKRRFVEIKSGNWPKH